MASVSIGVLGSAQHDKSSIFMAEASSVALWGVSDEALPSYQRTQPEVFAVACEEIEREETRFRPVEE